MPLNNSLFFTIPELALAFNRADRTIRDWIGRWRQKVKRNGDKYYLPDIIRNFEEEFGTKKQGDVVKIKNQMNIVRLEKERLELKILLEKYVDREDIESEWRSMAMALRQAILVMESKMAERCVGVKTTASARKMLREEAINMLDNMYKFGEYRPKIIKNNPELEAKLFEQFWQKVDALHTTRRTKKTPKIEIK